jgi:hypothetical protein
MSETGSVRWTFARLLVVLLFSTIALAAALSPMQNDTWWHLRAGADMWAAGRVLLTDHYSHTAHGAFWPNHEWLSELAFYGIYKAGGLPLVSLSTAACIVAAWGLTWWLMIGSPLRRFVMVAAVLLPASLHWEPRPHAFSLLFLMTIVWLVLNRHYLWLPLIFWLWANCHGGVLLGLVVLVAALSTSLLDEPSRWRRIAFAFAGCLLAVTATPLGMSFWVELPHSIARIRQYPINEWQSPSPTDLRLLPFWIAAALLCAGLALRWRALFTESTRQRRIMCACAVALLPFALSAVRNIGPFLMLALPAVSAIFTVDFSGGRWRRDERPLMNLSLMSAALLAVAMTLAYAYAVQIPRLRWTPLPAGSLQALRQCPDNLYNRYDEGGYLIWFAPDRLVFLDGRQDPYPPSLVHEQIRTESSGDFAATFARYDIRCAYLPASSLVARNLSAAGWTSLYSDSDWVVLTDAQAGIIRAMRK